MWKNWTLNITEQSAKCICISRRGYSRHSNSCSVTGEMCNPNNFSGDPSMVLCCGSILYSPMPYALCLLHFHQTGNINTTTVLHQSPVERMISQLNRKRPLDHFFFRFPSFPPDLVIYSLPRDLPQNLHPPPTYMLRALLVTLRSKMINSLVRSMAKIGTMERTGKLS